MMDEVENVADYRNVTPPRKFGTDLSASTLANPSAKKVVRIRKSSTKKKRSSKTRGATDLSTAVPSSIDKASALTYSVHFEPGPIGLKLEPVVASMGTDVGCRVLEFADGGEQDPGQARKSGKKIQPGDLLVAIDGRDVVSWNYSDIIALLRRKPGPRGRDMTFRSVRSPVDSPSEPVVTSADRTMPEEAPTTPVKKYNRMDYTSMEDFAFTQSPAEAILHSHFLSGFQDAEQAKGRESLKHEVDVSELSLEAEREDEESNAPRTSVSQSLASDAGEEDTCFSPSSVKALSAVGLVSNSKGTSPTPKNLSNVVKTVYKTVAPTAGVVVSGSYSLTSTLTSAMSMKLGEVLVGHTSKDFENAVQLKMQLLAELSQAKLTIDRQLEEHRRLEEMGQQLVYERDSEREARENVEKEMRLYQEEKSAVELQLNDSRRTITEISQQLVTEQQKLRNTLKDGDMQVKALEATVVALSAQAEQDRHERNVLNSAIKNLHVELRDKNDMLDAAESTLVSVKEDARVAEEEVRCSLESAIEARDAIMHRLRDLEKQIDENNAKLNHAESRLEETSKECQRIQKAHAETLQEISCLQASATMNDEAKTRVENELASTCSKLSALEHQFTLMSEEVDKKVGDRDKKLAEVKADSDILQATIASLRRELGEKDEALQRAVDATSSLQSEHKACADQISALKATIEDTERQKIRVVDELKKSENGNLRMEQLWAQMTEKDSKLAALDTHLSEAVACLEAMKEKLNEKVKALTSATDREESLRDKHDTLLRHIIELESAVKKAHHEGRLVEEKNRQTESELSRILGQVILLQSNLSEIEMSRNEARKKIESLKQSERTLVACNEKLRVNLEQSEAELAASGISLLSNTALIDELRSLSATHDFTAYSTTAELDALRAKHDEVLAKATGLEVANSELRAENESLTNELRSAKDELSASYNQANGIESSITASESAKVELEARLECVETSLIDKKRKLSSSQTEALQHNDDVILHLRDSQSRKLDDFAKVVINEKEQATLSIACEKRILENNEVATGRDLVSRASIDISDMTLAKEHDRVVTALKSEVKHAHQLVKSLRTEKGHAVRDLFEMRETLWVKEKQIQEDRGHFKEQKGILVAQIQALERERSSLDSDYRLCSQRVSFLSEELGREKENISGLKRSRDVACEEVQRLRSDITKAQEEHIEDIEQMLEELDSKTRMEAKTILVRELKADTDSKVKDLECSLRRSTREVEELRCTLQSARQVKEDMLDLLMTSRADLEQKMSNRLMGKEEEIVARDIRVQELQSRIDAEEKSLAEAQVAYKTLENQLVVAERREANATAEARTFSRQLKAMEDDLYAMAKEIEMLIHTNEVMEERLIEMKAARAAAEADAGTHGAVASAHEKINVDLKTKLEEQVDRNRVFQKEIASLLSSIDQFRIKKEKAEAEKGDVAQLLKEANFALRASADIVKERDNELQLMRARLGKTNEQRFQVEIELRKSNESTTELQDKLEKVHRESQLEIRQLQSHVEQLRIDVDEKDSTLSSQGQHLVHLTHELETRSQELQQLQSHVAQIQKDVDEKDATSSCQSQDLLRLTDELETRSQELLLVAASRAEAVSKVNELTDELETRSRELLSVKASRAEALSKVNKLRKSIETAESLQEELLISQDIAAKLEVSNRTLIHRVDELEAVHEQTMNNLAEAEIALSSSVQLSKDLEHQVQETQAEGDHLRTRVQLLQSTISRLKSERLLQEGVAQELEGQIARAAEVKYEREVSSLQSDNDAKARSLIELAAKLAARSRLIAHSKMFEQTLMSFIEKLVYKTESLLVGVSGHALKLKLMTGDEMDKSIEALDLACNRQSRVASSVSCNELFYIVSNARRDFDDCKQELQHLKRRADCGASAHLTTPPPTPKYTKLSFNLSKMKQMLDERDDCSSFLPCHEESLRGMVDYVELQIDGLISDLFAARRALESKDEVFAELKRILATQESEKESLHKNLKSMQIYIKQMEGKLAEVRSIDEAHHPFDETNKAEMKNAAVRIICNALQRRDTASAGQAFRKWSNNTSVMKAVDQQRCVAEALARQLDITREKLAILKSHLKHSTRSRREGSRHLRD